MLHVTQCYFARGNSGNDKTSFKPGKAKSERRSNFEILTRVPYGDIHYITNSFCKNVLNITLHILYLFIRHFV